MLEAGLQSALDDARGRTLQRVLLSGEEGVGRTRQLMALPGVVVQVGVRSVLSQTLRALLALGEVVEEDAALAALAKSPALDGLEPERAAVAVELLSSLLGIRRVGFRTETLDEGAVREGASLELARWVVERAQPAPFVIAFDDAHLSDEEGVAFIDALAHREEPVPLVIVVAHDASSERFSQAFRARRTLWLGDATWRQLQFSAPQPAELSQVLTRLGASDLQATALVHHAACNPGLALGLWPALRDGADLHDLPATLNELRLQRVSMLGDEVLTACATLAVLGGSAPLPALEAVDPGSRAALLLAVAAGVVMVERAGPFEVCRFCDPRMTQSLLPALTSAKGPHARQVVGVWAARSLSELAPESFGYVAKVLVPLAAPALDEASASLWHEAWAATHGGGAETAARLELALQGAQGVRRLVLLRRLAEMKLFLGQPEAALADLATAAKLPAGVALTKAPAPERLLAAQRRAMLDRWDLLSSEEARAANELMRAECLSHLLKKEETERAFADLERRLQRLAGPSVPYLWIRWAKAWSWFLCEVLGRPTEAVKACALVRRQVDPKVLVSDEDAIAFVRAEEVAATSVGEFERARALTEEHITLAERAGSLRDAALAWNARAIVHYGLGELVEARRGFERALELARTTGWLRREAITLHNLSLVLTELGAFDAAFTGESTYAKLSSLMGNHAARAEAPLVLATIELARGRLFEAEALLTSARKVAETNGWDMLVAQARALTGRLRLLRFLATADSLEVTRARNDLLAAFAVLDERTLAWTEELDPGELVALHAVALKWSGQLAQARDAVARAFARLPRENVVSRKQLEVAEAMLNGKPPGTSLGWFEQRGFIRRVELWRALGQQ